MTNFNAVENYRNLTNSYDSIYKINIHYQKYVFVPLMFITSRTVLLLLCQRVV